MKDTNAGKGSAVVDVGSHASDRHSLGFGASFPHSNVKWYPIILLSGDCAESAFIIS